MIKKRYSTRFYCPRCKRQGQSRMLWYDEGIKSLRCEEHLNYIKVCDCKITDLITYDIEHSLELSQEEEEVLQKSIEDLPRVDTELEALEIQEERLEYEMAMALKEGIEDSDDLVIGFE